MQRICPWGVLVAALAAPAPVYAGEVVPTDGMVIREDTTFATGRYVLPSGIIIGASDLTLDLNGAELIGAFDDSGPVTYGITVSSHDNVTITNGTVRGYYYGMFVKNATNVQIIANDLSYNWVDPDSLEPPAPFLNINVGPILGDTTNLGGGLFMKDVDVPVIAGNTMQHNENGMDLYNVTGALIEDNDTSHNTGWGIHLHGSTGNTITGCTADHCTRPGLGDSAGVLLVMSSSDNVIEHCSFQHSGDGFFIGNEHGCPSNDNIIRNSNGSFAGANAFEATFSSGNQFLDNIASSSNYGFWLGYSHSGNVIRGNIIHTNNVNGIEIEHGQNNIIESNSIVANGGSAVLLRTDGIAHFPPASFPCLQLPDQESSRAYTVTGNVITHNFGWGFNFTNTADSTITNNLVALNSAGTAISNGAGNTWSHPPLPGENIVGGPFLAGNYWDNYAGKDTDGDMVGDTMLPYTNGGSIALPGDAHPLTGDPDLDVFDNPMSLCARQWIDLGRNMRASGGTFDTANGAHFATDDSELYLLEGTNSTRLSRFDPVDEVYESRANAPESVWDGGGFQYGGGVYFATVGVQFNPANGSGKGAKLYAYEAGSNTWSERADTVIHGDIAANESIAYDPVSNLLFATIVNVITGGDTSLRQRLAMYDPDLDQWIGATSASGTQWDAGSEAEYLDGKIYVWPGGLRGGAVSGSDSYLHIYDISTDTWDETLTLQDSGVIPGFRSGAFDIWGVAITADHGNSRLFVIGGEANRQVYVLDVTGQKWTVAPDAVYDGGWGDGLEFVAGSQRLYQIDGRNATGSPQGTAVLVKSSGDVDGDGAIGFSDLLAVLSDWGACADSCCPSDVDEDGSVGFADLLLVLTNWG